ncbi:antitoxin Xre/MbcA/ParS toxin-binding domain-containing protein [Xanthomonas albilineans]|uniref:antitoxin Xre/MbcA/ParS toxin-binding domain-containing protein n=1 Tax=Xanthomonas albilineans TaxID=29447 RepID=UPI0009BA64BD
MINKVNWVNFVKCCSDEWVDNDITREMSEIVKCDDIERAVWACLHSRSVIWLNSRVPILDKKRPIDLLSTEEGRDKIRWILMSNPWW